MRNLGWWLFDKVPLGPLAPYLLGLLLGSKPKRVR